MHEVITNKVSDNLFMCFFETTDYIRILATFNFNYYICGLKQKRHEGMEDKHISYSHDILLVKREIK